MQAVFLLLAGHVVTLEMLSKSELPFDLYHAAVIVGVADVVVLPLLLLLETPRFVHWLDGRKDDEK